MHPSRSGASSVCLSLPGAITNSSRDTTCDRTAPQIRPAAAPQRRSGIAMMAFYVRAFCVHGEVRPSALSLPGAAEHGLDLTPPPQMPSFMTWVGVQPPDWRSWIPQELAGRAWDGADLWWQGLDPLEVVIDDRDEAQGDVVAESPPLRQRDQVLAHLAGTRFLARMRLPISASRTTTCGTPRSYKGDGRMLETTW
jgi:hypothetical protein